MQYETVYRLIQQIKEQRPLILNLTNQVTMDFVANGLLSLGASPIMTQGLAELRDLIQLADGIIINIGTLTDEFLTLCEQACLVANELAKPIIFDPVGAGASQYRTEACLHLLKRYRFSTIRGNASEINALCLSSYTTKGVEASITTAEALDTATCFSTEHKAVLVISGQTDAVIQGAQINLFARGSSLMPAITGSGCLLTAIIGAFQVCSSDAYLATCAAVVFYGVCGERAASLAEGPGSFKVHFLDALAQLPQRGDYDQE